jgi:hypothetical protein
MPYWNALYNDEVEVNFLNEFGQIVFGKFRIDVPIDGKSDGDMGLPLPDVPMPSNIANFKEIHLWFAFSGNGV